MAQLDVHRYRGGEGFAEFVVDLQVDFLSDLDTRLVAPLYRPGDGPKVLKELNPEVDFGEGRFHVMMQQMGAIRKARLGPTVASLASHRRDIIAALDFLITGV